MLSCYCLFFRCFCSPHSQKTWTWTTVTARRSYCAEWTARRTPSDAQHRALQGIGPVTTAPVAGQRSTQDSPFLASSLKPKTRVWRPTGQTVASQAEPPRLPAARTWTRGSTANTVLTRTWTRGLCAAAETCWTNHRDQASQRRETL